MKTHVEDLPTEEQAKAILDFLAKKAGVKFKFARFEFLYARALTSSFSNRVYSYRPGLLQAIAMPPNDRTYAYVVKQFLLESSAGNDIITKKGLSNEDIMILPKHHTYDQLLVEMDLDV